MCDCDRALELLSLELDGELTPEEKGELEDHLTGCGECRRTAEELRQLHTILPELEEEVPDGLHQAIMDRIGAEKVVPLSSAAKGRRSLRQWVSLAAVFAVILLGAGTLKTLQSGGSTATAPAAANAAPQVTAATQDTASGGAESGGADQAEEQPKMVSGQGDVCNDAAQPTQESADPQDAAPQDGEGEGAALRMSPPASAQPTPVPEQAEETGKSGQTGGQQAVTFSIMPAEAASSEAAQPDEETTETLRANCAAWLADSTFDQKDRVDTALVSVVQVTEGDLASAVCDSESAALLDGTDWAVTLGDTTGHDYAVLLCDSVTLAVLGYVPIA